MKISVAYTCNNIRLASGFWAVVVWVRVSEWAGEVDKVADKCGYFVSEARPYIKRPYR